MKKNIFILQPEFDLIRPRSIRTTNIFKYLSKDYNLYLLKFRHPKSENKNPIFNYFVLDPSKLFSPFLNKEYNSVLNNRNIILRLISYFINENSIFPDHWSIEHKKIIKEIKKEDLPNIDYLFSSIKPFSNAILSNRLKKLEPFKNATQILDIGDPFAHNAMSKIIKPKDIEFEKGVLLQADHIIVTNTETKNHYINDFQISNESITVIPQGVDTNLIDKQVRKTRTNNCRIKAIYAGIFYKELRDPSNIIEVINKNNQQLKVDFDFYGSNLPPSKFYNVKNRINQNDLIKKYLDSDILLFFDNAFGIQTPGKIYELLAIKKPILFIYSNENSPVLKLMKNYKHVIFVDNKVTPIKKALLELPSLLAKIKKPEYSAEEFSWHNRAMLLQSILKS